MGSMDITTTMQLRRKENRKAAYAARVAKHNKTAVGNESLLQDSLSASEIDNSIPTNHIY